MRQTAGDSHFWMENFSGASALTPVATDSSICPAKNFGERLLPGAGGLAMNLFAVVVVFDNIDLILMRTNMN
jgi:hypothetical protein